MLKNKRWAKKRGLKCKYCSKKKKLTQHHIDNDPKNNTDSNLMLLCRKCHDKFHGIIPKKDKLKDNRQNETNKKTNK